MHPVIKEILKRKGKASKPGIRDDNFKIGLAIEGGGMRGVVSAGMVTGLEYLKLLDSFDAVYGTSAGAINAAYFIAKQASYGTTIYYENINNDNFINIYRFSKKNKSIMSLEFLLDYISTEIKILDCDLVNNSPVPLKIIATSITKNQSKIFEKMGTREELINALRASARIPIIAGPPVKINGEEFLDGGILESIPIYTAIKDNCTHILVLLTRPHGDIQGKPTIFDNYFAARALRRINPWIAEAYLTRPRKYCQTIKEIEKLSTNPLQAPFVFGIQLSSDKRPVSRLEKKQMVLKKGAKDGLSEVIRAFTDECPMLVTEILCPYNGDGHKIESD